MLGWIPAAAIPPLPVLVLLGAYCVLIVLASLAGGWLPSLVRLTHLRMQVLISLVAGLMLGIGLFHLLPHAVDELHHHRHQPSLDPAVQWMMAGLLTMFFLIRAFRFHSHAPAEQPEKTDAPTGHPHDHDLDRAQASVPLASHGRDAAAMDHPAAVIQSHRLGWLGVALGLSLHTLIDGVALAASVQAESHHAAGWSLFGLGTFLAIVLHKPLDAVSITSLMAASGWSPKWRNFINAGFALMCPLGAALFLLGVHQFSDYQHLIVGAALAFAAGVFLCISLADLLPELEFHSHDRLKLSLALLCGVALAWAIGFLEPPHAH